MTKGEDLAARSWLFGVDLGGFFTDSKLYRIDSRTATLVEVGELGANDILDVAFLSDGRLYAARAGFFSTDLLSINPRTASSTFVGSIAFSGVNALVADEFRLTLLGATVAGEFLRIDPATGLTNFIGFYGSGFGSAGDLAWDDQGVLYGLAFTGGACCNPAILIRVDPKTGQATQVGQAIGFDNVFGLAFQSRTILAPGNSGVEVTGPTLLAVADGDALETPKLIEIDRQTGQGTLIGSLNAFNGMGGLASNIRKSPTLGSRRAFAFDVIDSSNDCLHSPSIWTYCQHRDGVTHADGINVDDLYAWDANLSGNADRGKPVYSMSSGTVVSFYEEVEPGEGSFNAVLLEHCLVPGPCNCDASPSDCWWSRYLHMDEVLVLAGESVSTDSVLGRIGSAGVAGVDSDHLHVAVYEGENRRDGTGQGLLVSVDARIISDEPGLSDTASLVVPGFEVDIADPSGATTFFAVRNTTDSMLDVDVAYYGEIVGEEPLRLDSIELQAQETRTLDIRSDLSGLNVNDGFATGLVVIQHIDASTGVPTATGLEGDYFRLSFADDFAAGDRLVRPSEEFCLRQEIRFVDFGSGSQLRILVDRPRGATLPSFLYTAYKETGEVVASADFFTSNHLSVLDIGELVGGQRFGTVLFDFTVSGGGWVSAKYSAFGRFSVELNGACRDE